MRNIEALQLYKGLIGDGFVDGQLQSSQSSDRIKLVSPRDGASIADFPRGTEGDVDAAVVAARRCFEDGRWSGLAPSERKTRMLRWADLVAREASALDAIDALEMGKPRAIATFNAYEAASLLRYYGEAIDKISGTCFPSDSNSTVFQKLLPRGVVAAIAPWNFPTFNAVMKVAPALAVGNSVILKPSEMSPTSAIVIAGLAAEAGIPAGALNVVLGLGDIVGAALALHADIDMITFTGSTIVGKKILEYSGRSNMKVVIAECGGKSPQIVFDDGVDLEAAAAAVARSILLNQGQVCSAGSRLLVQAGVVDAFLDRIIKKMQAVRMGDPLDPSTDYGPLVSARQLERVNAFISQAIRQGATLLYSGNLTTVSGGFYAQPTILVDVEPHHAVAREEIFGPVLSVIPFEGVDDAIRLANDTSYGLVAYCWTGRLDVALRLGASVRTALNIVSNRESASEGPGLSLSGESFGISGVGIEGGLDGLKTFCRRQLVWVNH